MTTTDPIIIDNVPYYACATTAQAAELGEKGTGTTQLCTADDVLKGTYGVTFVEDTKVSYAQNQAVAYVDLEKDTLPEDIDQELNLNLLKASAFFVLAEEDKQQKEVQESRNRTASYEFNFGGWSANNSQVITITFSIRPPASITVSGLSTRLTSQTTAGGIEIANVTSYFSISSAAWNYKIGNAISYQTFQNGQTLYSGGDYIYIKCDVTVTCKKSLGNPQEYQGAYNLTPTCTLSYSYKTQQLVSQGNKYTKINQVSSDLPNSFPGQSFTPLASRIECASNVVDLYLSGPTVEGRSYRSGTDSDNVQRGFIIPIYLQYEDTAYNTSEARELASFELQSCGTQAYNDKQIFKNAITGSVFGGNDWWSSVDGSKKSPIQWKLYKGFAPSSKTTDEYDINSLCNTNLQNWYILELKWDQKNLILPEGSLQTTKQLCSSIFELDIQPSQNSNKVRSKVYFNIWLSPFKKTELPKPTIQDDKLYIRMKTQDIIFQYESETQKNRYKTTFGQDVDFTKIFWQEERVEGDATQRWYSISYKNPNGKLGGEGMDIHDPWFSDVYFSGEYGIESLFTGNKDIFEVIFPKWVWTVGYRCFEDCINLEKITFKSPLHTIRANAFCQCSSLSAIDLSPITGDLTIERKAFYNNTNATKLIVSPNAFLTVYGHAFQNNSNMQLFVGNDNGGFEPNCGFDGIGRQAFKDCHKLGETLHLGRCNIIDLNAFENCSTIKNIYVKWVDYGTTMFTAWTDAIIKTNAFKGCTNVEHFYSWEYPAIVHGGNIWYKNAINPQTAKLHVEANRYSQYANWAQFGDFNTYGNLIGDLN